MKTTRPLRLAVMTVIAAFVAGCATSADRGPEPTGIVVEGEVVQQTGSRISHIVRKDGPAGIAADRPGMVSGSGRIQSEQNDFRSQYGGK